VINDYDPELPLDFPEADPPMPPGWKLITQDDMDPSTRECFHSSPGDKHRATCPDCLESDAENTLVHARLWRQAKPGDEPAPYTDGTPRSRVQCAAELEAEAAADFEKAATIREARGQHEWAAEARARAVDARRGVYPVYEQYAEEDDDTDDDE
jgi:hypothetical protein